jgi:hypothetical protein
MNGIIKRLFDIQGVARFGGLPMQIGVNGIDDWNCRRRVPDVCRCFGDF